MIGFKGLYLLALQKSLFEQQIIIQLNRNAAFMGQIPVPVFNGHT
jgi:predicted RNA binding protein with dsRBD fold (UPF0201 family)